MIFKRLTLYVCKTVIATTVMIVVALSAIFMIFSYLSEAGDIGQGQYNALSAFIYVLYQVPYNLYLIMPVCGLIGSLMGLGLLANNSELIVMRATGQSTLKIGSGVILAGVIIGVLTFLVGGYWVPATQKQGAIYKTTQTQKHASLSVYDAKSLWLHQKNRFIFIGDTTQAGGKVANLKRYTVKNNQLTQVASAKQAHYQNDDQWKLKDVNVLTLDTEPLAQQYYPTMDMDHLLPPDILNITQLNQRYLNFNQLATYMWTTQQHDAAVSLKFWQTIFQPLSLIILMLMAVPFSLGSTRSSAVGFKLIIGALLGFAFYLINQIFAPVSLIYHLPPLLGASIPIIIFLIILVLLFWKLRE